MCDVHMIIVHENLLEDQLFENTGPTLLGTNMTEQGAMAKMRYDGRNFHMTDQKAQRLNKIRRLMESIGRKLGIAKQIIELGFRYHKIASHKATTHGRETNIVAAACLYMACRIERSPHLLIDFADVIKEDLFRISEVFNKFRSQILLKEHSIPIVDPSLYIEKFCLKLNFEDKF